MTALVTGLLVPVMISWARARGLFDVPNERSSHSVPTPRVGGVALVVAVFAGLSVARLNATTSLPHGAVLAAGSLAIAAVSFVDDLRPLPVLVRLAGQFVVATGVAIGLGPWPASAAVDRILPLTMAFTALWIIAFVNAYNFMDGVDGLAGGQAVVAGLGWATVGAAGCVPVCADMALVIAAAGAVFLYFNWHPARVFMGDTGSAFFGYAFAVMPLAGPPTLHHFVAAALFIWPFVFDTAFTFLRRFVRGDNVLAAHRTHLYQRLTATGLRHSQVSLMYMALAALGWPAGIAAAHGLWLTASAFSAVIAVAAFLLWRRVVWLERHREAGRDPATEVSDAETTSGMYA